MMQSLLVDFVVLSCLYLVTGEEMVHCTEGWYHSRTEGLCKPCSTCPANKIVRETCSENKDTQCGSFTEFKIFHSSKTHNLLHSSESAEVKPDDKPIDNVVTKEADDNASWHAITMAMVVLLSITGIMFVSFVSVVYYRSRRLSKDGLIAQVDKDSDFEKPDDRCQRATTSREDPSCPYTTHIEQFEIAIDT